MNTGGANIDRTYLLLDSRIVEYARNCRLTIGEVSRHPSNPLFGEDKPWEPRFDNLYANVLLDPDDAIFKCWYSPFVTETAVQATTPEERRISSWREVRKKQRESGSYKRTMGICYAESRDGLNWTKPALHVHEWDGAPSNVLLVGPHGAGVFKDEADLEPERRYKMIARLKEGNDSRLGVALSRDGIRWGPMRSAIENVAGDTHNCALWLPDRREYAVFTRQWPDNVRAVFRSSSRDFLEWSTPVEVLRGFSEVEQVYSMPVFAYRNVYLGLPTVFNTKSDRTYTALAWSPDTVNWEWIDGGKPLIPLSDERTDIDWGCTYGAASPIIVGNDIRLYYGASDGPHTDFRTGYFALATMHLDGFAGYEPEDPDKPAIIETAPLRWHGGPVMVRRDPGRGSIGISVVDTDGNVVAHATSAHDGPEATVRLVPAIRGAHTVRFRFEIDHAKIYSFATQGEGETDHAN